jgi:hypothetical protein
LCFSQTFATADMERRLSEVEQSVAALATR